MQEYLKTVWKIIIIVKNYVYIFLKYLILKNKIWIIYDKISLSKKKIGTPNNITCILSP